jgi:hypothetical protein
MENILIRKHNQHNMKNRDMNKLGDMLVNIHMHPWLADWLGQLGGCVRLQLVI